MPLGPPLSSQIFCDIHKSGISETENLSSLASMRPRDPGASSFTVPSILWCLRVGVQTAPSRTGSGRLTRPQSPSCVSSMGSCGSLLRMPTQSPEVLAGSGSSLPLPLFPHVRHPANICRAVQFRKCRRNCNTTAINCRKMNGICFMQKEHCNWQGEWNQILHHAAR